MKWRKVFLGELFCLSGIVSLTNCTGVSPQFVGSRRWLGKCLVAGIHWLASGRGRPACCTGACISVELSSLIPTGSFPQPTAFKSEFALSGAPREGLGGDKDTGREEEVRDSLPFSSGLFSGAVYFHLPSSLPGLAPYDIKTSLICPGSHYI